MANHFFCAEFIVRKFLLMKHLPRMDSNYDKVIQSHLEQNRRFPRILRAF